MSKHLATFIHSFRFSEKHWFSFVLDFVLVGLIVLLFSLWNNLAKSKYIALVGTTPPADFQQLLLSKAPDQLQIFVQQLQTFLIFFIIGFVLLLLFSWLLFSLDIAVVWNYLLNKPFHFRRYWRWNVLHLALILPVLVYFFLFILVKVILGVGFSALTTQSLVLQNIDQFVNFFAALFLLIVLSLIYYSFSTGYAVFQSIVAGFNLLQQHWKSLWRALLLMVVVAYVVSFIIWLLQRQFILSSTIMLGINIFISLLYLSWLRMYLLSLIHESPHSAKAAAP